MRQFNFLSNELSKRHKVSVGNWKAEHKQPPDTLYHYTNAPGLIGIISSKSIWASNVCFLNDSRELIHGRSEIEDVLKGTSKDNYSEPVRKFLDDCLNRVTKGNLEMDVYAACFCSGGDVLSQWRAYGAMGDGYSIGLRASELEKLGKSTDFNYKLRKVIYEPHKQRELISSIVCDVCNLLEQATVAKTDEEISLPELNDLFEDAGKKLDDHLKEYIYCFKHPAFSEEMEWRLVHICPAAVYNKTLQFRSSGGKVVPYVSLQLVDSINEALLPLARLRYGAVRAPETTEKALKHLLNFYNYAEIVPEHSDVPLVT